MIDLSDIYLDQSTSTGTDSHDNESDSAQMPLPSKTVHQT